LVELVIGKCPVYDASGIRVQVLASGPSHQDSSIRKVVISMISEAKSEVTIVVPYFVPDDALLVAITSAAQRGVQVNIINSASIDKKIVGYAQRSFYEDLLSAGVQVHLYNEPIFLHTKHMTIDKNICLIGSSNFDIRSFELDLEISSIIYDNAFVDKLNQIEADYLTRCQHLDLAEWRSRSNLRKISENIARLTSSLQ
jgi:cardiolipin synthase A/B